VLTLVAESAGGAWRTVAESSAVTGLGRGSKTSGLLAESSIVETLRAVQDGFALAREHGAQQIVAAGTMALRITRNANDFLARAAEQGTPVTVISGDEEARLGFQAVAADPTFADAPILSIIDPGGHSTELVVAQRTGGAWSETFRTSFPIGALALREGHLHDESPQPGDIVRASSEIDALLPNNFQRGDCGLAVTLGATGTNLISIREQLSTWQPERVHGQVLQYEEISRAVGWMCAMSDHERRDLVGLEPGREQTIHIGSLILERFLYAMRCDQCVVSVRGWRHALLAEMA